MKSILRRVPFSINHRKSKMTLVFFFVLTTIVSASVRAAIVMALVATIFLAIFATALAIALIPDRVGHHIQRLDWRNRVAALDHQFASHWTLLRRLVANYHA